MVTNQHIWHSWAHNLHRWGLAEWVATLLDAAGPFTLLAAQLTYLVQPLANNTAAESHLHALTELLEDTQNTHSFATLLRKGFPE
jgi:hypothetical protein